MGCVDVIDYNLDRESEKLSISGQLTDKLGEQSILVEKSVLLDKSATLESAPIENAQVSVFDGSTTINFTHSSKGRYVANFKCESDKNYTLNVKIGDKNYKSFAESLPKGGEEFLPSAEYAEDDVLTKEGIVVKEQKVVLKVDGRVKEGEYLLFRSSGEYEFKEFDPLSTRNKSCYIPVRIDDSKLNLMDFTRSNAGSYKQLLINKVDLSDYFFTNYCFHVYQYSVNKKAYDYWSRVSQILNTGSGLFEAPPGKILGNIKSIVNLKEEVLGYFTVASELSNRVFTNGFKMGVKVTDPCGFRVFQERPQSCNQCTLIPFSQTLKPSYWP